MSLPKSEKKLLISIHFLPQKHDKISWVMSIKQKSLERKCGEIGRAMSLVCLAIFGSECQVNFRLIKGEISQNSPFSTHQGDHV